MLYIEDKESLAYVIGVAIGDGNLSNPNKRAVRLRVTCDSKYPNLIKKITKNIKKVAPDNKVSLVKRNDSCVDVSCYSNDWEKILGWKASNGPKHTQKIRSPKWIFSNKKYIRPYLRGLIETDGSVYKDRKYITLNFTTIIPSIAEEVSELLNKLGYTPNTQISYSTKNPKYVVRVSKNTKDLIEELEVSKS